MLLEQDQNIKTKILNAIMEDPEIVLILKEKYVDEDIWKYCIEREPSLFKKMKHPSESLCMFACEVDGSNLKWIKNKFSYIRITDVMAYTAVKSNPKAILYVAIDNPKKTALLSSYTTAPVARRILLDIIDALDIEKQDGGIEKVHEWMDPTYIIVPDVVGKTVKEATKELYPLEVEYSGTGEKVIEQSPSAGTKVETTSKVRLMLTS